MRAPLAALLGVILATVGAAQAGAPAAVRSALDALRSDLAWIGPVELVQAQTDANRLGAVQARVLQLEEELRRLTGRVEEAEYQQQQTQARLDRLVGDIDARLRAMEDRGGGAGVVRAPAGASSAPLEPAPPPAPLAARADPPVIPRTVPAPAPQGAAPVAPAPAVRGAADVPPDAAAARGYVLGTLPREALMREPERGQPDSSRSPVPPPAQVARAPSVTAAPRSAGPRVRYEAALEMLQAGDLGAAQQEFTSFVDDYPDDPLAPNAAYWLAETHYVQRDYQTAAALFARNYRTYGENAAKAPDNLLKLGMSLALAGDADRACQTYGELERRHANAPAPIRQELARAKAASSCR